MLFNKHKFNGIELKNRIVMAPMTRARNPNSIPNEMNATYYRQRAGAGLIVTEGVAISPTASGVLHIPGLYSEDQVKGWKLVTEAAHNEGAKIVAQLWHVGRVSHTSIQPEGISPVGPSTIPASNSFAWGYDENGKESFVSCSSPHSASAKEIEKIVNDFAAAASNAVSAGFDGVELHGANGYLIEQFLNPLVNIRTDKYGGSIENRSRFLLQAIDACIDKIGSHKVAIRLTPYGGLHEMPHYSEIDETYQYLAQELGKRNIAYIHIMDQKSRGSFALPEGFLQKFRKWYNGVVILAGGMNRTRSEELVRSGTIDLAAFGEPFIANPDLVERLKHDWPIATSDRASHYGGSAKGYTDYPGYDTILQTSEKQVD